MRVSRVASTAFRPRPMLAPMPTAHPVQPLPAAAPGDLERERAELSRALAERWPRAARDVLTIAARIDAHNRRAAALGLAPIAAAEPLAAAGAMWAALGALHPVASPARPGAGPRTGRAHAR